jgi:hypothetical protein
MVANVRRGVRNLIPTLDKADSTPGPREEYIRTGLSSEFDGVQGWIGEIEGIDLTLSYLAEKRERAVRLNRKEPINLGSPKPPRRPI